MDAERKEPNAIQSLLEAGDEAWELATEPWSTEDEPWELAKQSWTTGEAPGGGEDAAWEAAGENGLPAETAEADAASAAPGRKRGTNIHEGHRQRLLNRYLTNGAGALSDVESVELLLGYALPRRDVRPLAQRLLRTFGSVRGVLSAMPEQLTQTEGVNPRTAVLLSLCGTLWDRGEHTQLAKGMVFRDMREIGKYLMEQAAGRREEAAWMVSLDAKGKLVDCRLLCTGSVNAVNLPFRKLVEVALMVNASSVILAHCHATGAVIPSREDILYTRDAGNALRSMGVTLVDHLVLGHSGWISMQDSRMM